MTRTQPQALLANNEDNLEPDPQAALGRAFLTAIARTSGERARRLEELAERWRARRFVTIVTGEFKRGKSTLLNALAGADVLPTGVLPVTTVPTRVSRGSSDHARAVFRDGTDRAIALEQVRDYVDEGRNPGNRLGVASVEIELAAGVPPGVVFVDVPGLGSSHTHNTEAALAALPEADAALVVVSVDPPLGEAELGLLENLRNHAARVDVVLNKVDCLDEAGRAASEEFTREMLARHGFDDASVWPVSAREGLLARLAGDDVGWRRSGMAALDGSLAHFFRQEREVALAQSLARKAGRLVGQELALIEIEHATLERNSSELRTVIAAFDERRTTADRDTEDLEDAAAALLLRRVGLRRLAGRAIEEADERYGRAVEQTRESFSRAYEADFRTLIVQFSHAAEETARGVGEALHAAEVRVANLDRSTRDSTEGLRLHSLRELQQELQGIEGGRTTSASLHPEGERQP